MIRVGLIGCGKISVAHLDAFDHIDKERAQIVAACDLSEHNLKAVTDHTGAAGYADYKKMVEEVPLDLVIITLPHGLHSEATCFCAEHKLDVFLEKPMGISSDDCQKMIDCCKKNGVMFWVGHLQRYLPQNMLAKHIMETEDLGELVSFTEIRAVNYFSEDRPRWFTTRKMSGGGMMINLGAHALDKLKFFTGGADIKDIHGKVHMHEGSDCEDSAQCFVEMSNGVTATLNMIGHIPAHFNRWILYFTKGEIRIDSGESVSYCGEDGVFKTVTPEHIPGMRTQIAELIDVMEGDKKPVVDGEYGLDIIHAIKRLYGEEK